MDEVKSLVSRLRRFAELPADLAAVVAVTLLVNIAVFVPLVQETPVRIPLAILFVCVVPGYAAVAALFPEATEPADLIEWPHSTIINSLERIDWFSRIVLSLGLSVTLVPLLGLVLTLTSGDLTVSSYTATLSIFTFFVTAVAVVRRRQLPKHDRFAVPYREWLTAVRTKIFSPRSRLDVLLNILLVCSILLAFGSVVFAVSVPSHSESFSEMHVLTEEDGELVTDGYPTEFERGESKPLVLGIENQERRSADYSVVIVEQDVETRNNETVVEEQRELDRFSKQLEHNQTWLHEHELEPTMTGDNIRIAWLLYLDDDIPASPSVENADYYVHLWVSVDETNNATMN